MGTPPTYIPQIGGVSRLVFPFLARSCRLRIRNMYAGANEMICKGLVGRQWNGVKEIEREAEIGSSGRHLRKC